MAYVIAVAIGFISVTASIVVFDEAMRILFYYDARYFMGRFWFISLPLISFIFAIGFYLTLRKLQRRRLIR